MKTIAVLIGILLAVPAMSLDLGGDVVFEAGFSCKDKPFLHASFCISTRPKDFSDKEKIRVLEAFEALPDAAVVIMDKLVEKHGPIKIRRFERGYEAVSLRTFKAKTGTIAWVDSARRNQLSLTDRFFRPRRMINEDYSIDTYTILHELMHLYDRYLGRASDSEEFMGLTGWREVETGNVIHMGSLQKNETRWEIESVDYAELEAVRAEIVALHGDNWSQAGIDLSLSWAASQGFPTTYALANPKECFAELLTNLLLDPPVMETVDPDLVQYLSSLLK